MRHILSVALLALVASLPARAELMIGGFPPTGTSQPLNLFARDAQGTAAPLRQITGPNTQLVEAASGVYEPVENVLYIADYRGRAVRVYPAMASGDVAPIRVLNTPQLGQVRSAVPIVAHDELAVIESNCCIAYYARTASGSAAPRLRSLSWGGSSGSVTQLNNAFSLVYLPGSDEVAVVDQDFGSNPQGKVLFFARSANGNAAPARVLQSSFTANARGIAFDAGRNLLYLLTETADGGGGAIGFVHVFAASATGTDWPLYSINGSSTQLNRGSGTIYSGIGVDRALQRVMVGIGSISTTTNLNRVVSFPQGQAGAVLPVQVVNGATLSAGQIGIPFAAPGEVVFANGFDR